MISIGVESLIAVHVQPEPFQHVRYENDNKEFLRYTKAADHKPIRIDVSLFQMSPILLSL